MSTVDKPFAPACERNREPILSVLQRQFADRKKVLEVGSGTGQHAVFFADAMPHLTWQTSDRPENLPGIRAWLADAGLANTPRPLAWDVNDDALPGTGYDAVFSANTLHIMGWDEVVRFFGLLPRLTAPGARVTVYGPFNLGGRFTSDSNARFDAMLKQDDPKRGIRDLEAVDALARDAGLVLCEDAQMPANNRCVTWERREMR
jgi:cyclopropane fatty-acyl-phospholipid synthase-like methyltransferase